MVQGGARVDLAVCLLGTLQHMLTQEDVMKAFRCVKDALVPQGLFIIELNHPSQLFDGGILASADTWTLEVEDAQLEVWWGHEGDTFDPFTQILDKNVTIDVMLRGGERKLLKDRVPLRQFTYQEMLLVAQSAGFKVLLRLLLAAALSKAWWPGCHKVVGAGGQDIRGLCTDFTSRS